MEEKIKIEKGVPMPSRASVNSKYPFGQMGVGDSFYVDKAPGKFAGSLTYARAHYRDMEFKARKDGNGTRVWRVA